MFSIIGGDGKEYGPVSVDQLREWLAQRRATLATLARRDGTAEWRPLGAWPEFAPAPAPAGDPAAPADPAAPPPLAPSVTPAAAPVPAPESPVFTGHWQEYFRIWIVNLLLTVVTLGIYAAWAKVRKRRYFAANTRLFGHTFEYLGDPLKILRGNLIVAALVLALGFSQAVSPFLYLLLALAFWLTLPWFIVRALAFNARNTAWRGLRFGFHGTTGEAAACFIGWPLLVPFTLGLLFPWIARKQKAFVIGRHSFGTTSFAFSGTTESFYKIYGVALLFFLPLVVAYFGIIATAVVAAVQAGPGAKGPPPLDPAALGVFGLVLLAAAPLAVAGVMFFRSRMFNFVWRHTSIGGHRFDASLRARDLFLTYLLNTLVTACTLGLLHPWAAVRMVRLQYEALRVVPGGSIDAFVAGAEPPVGALGEAASDAFDFDLGFGL